MKTLLIIFALVLTTFGQQVQPCDLTVDKAPSIRGLQLGMSESAAVALGVPDKFGPNMLEPYLRESSFIPGPADTRFHNISFVALGFFDNQLVNIRTTYSQDWKDIAEFVTNFSPKLGLPLTSWAASPLGPNYAQMRCKGFEVLLETSFGSSSLVLNDTSVISKIKERTDKDEAARKAALKP